MSDDKREPQTFDEWWRSIEGDTIVFPDAAALERERCSNVVPKTLCEDAYESARAGMVSREAVLRVLRGMNAEGAAPGCPAGWADCSCDTLEEAIARIEALS